MQPSSLSTAAPAQSELPRRWAAAALGAIAVLAAALRFANLSALGYANHYYTAAVESMLQSWHNFFFVAAEPGAAVTVDKPPVGLWLQALSAWIFGVNGFAVLLPQILAGIFSVLLLYRLVARTFGRGAGLLAALALAITPIVVATDRNNTIDSMLILALLLAAWAFIKAAETGRLRWLLAGAALVGVGFNIKMLQAFLPLPAFYALYVLGAEVALWRKLLNLGLASVLLAAISLSWALAVDLTPADQRPYVGSSTNNTVLELIMDHNGLDRLYGMFRPGGNGAAPAPGQNGVPGRPNTGPRDGFDGGFNNQQPNGNQPNNNPRPNGGAANGNQPNGGFPGGPGNPQGGFGGGNQRPGGGMPGTGDTGAQRLFNAPLSKEASWLLPFGILGMLVLALGGRPRWPLAARHRALVLWGGWLLTAAIFFSIAGFFHEYYLSMLAVPLAALVGIAGGEVRRISVGRPWPAAGLLLAGAGATLALQAAILKAFAPRGALTAGLVAAAAILAAAGTLGVLWASAGARRRWLRASQGALIASLLIAPLIWSALTTLYPSENQSLPSAYAGSARTPVFDGQLQINQALIDYLQPRTAAATYLMAVPSSMQGSDYVIATGRPVLYLGGFMGTEQVVTGKDLAALVASGQLRYLYWTSGGARGGFGGSNGEITRWVQSACQPVAGFDTVTQNTGAPDGTGNRANPTSQGGRMQVSLYDCAAAAGG